MPTPEILPQSDPPGSWRQHTIIGLSAAEIAAILGFESNVREDPDIVRYSRAFTVDGEPCAIWDYHNGFHLQRFSAWGPANRLEAVFGADHLIRQGETAARIWAAAWANKEAMANDPR